MQFKYRWKAESKKVGHRPLEATLRHLTISSHVFFVTIHPRLF